MKHIARAAVPALVAAVLISHPSSAQDRAVPPADAARRMSLPNGFRATLFAGEPDVVQPIAFTTDDRGRLWVVESFSYPKWVQEGQQGRDRVIILEDADGDGRHDSRKVFWDKGTNLSGIEVGFGGVWLCATPFLQFIPDRDGDDKPDVNQPEVLLDGWNLEKAQHNVFNGLTWGPDGWLYGMNGIQSYSVVGRPDEPQAQRKHIDCGVWRYHPVTRDFEVFASGTTNPWGLDFDDYGQMFITNCVIAHLWHVLPGAHYKRMYGQDINPYTYKLMDTCADHLHWGGGEWQESRGAKGKHGEAGGGHAHVGAMVYLGDNWPPQYRNGLFTCNLHGTRVNHDTLERRGSGYVAKHAPDFLLANDTFFRGLELLYGPDGAVYVSDWSDTGECHDFDGVVAESGRIFKVSYGQHGPVPVDVARLPDAQLVELQLHRNDWHVRHARRVLHERAAAGKLAPTTHAALAKILDENGDVTRKLRALWALYVTNGLDAARLAKLLDHSEEHVRAWAVRLHVEDHQAPPDVLARFAEMAKADPSPLVRVHLASALQRLPIDQRWPIAEALASHSGDATDPNLPLMIWYGIEPAVGKDKANAVALMSKVKIPVIREHIARRLAAKPADPAAKPAKD
ncbi:MAG TPA: PVC-type heme-binding CxxCH protein [Tepidisphaeraceae bacterium]|nr:PVC-type heme-binding CxxCH protein [Tepidisphaeraceae bacterium]